MYQSWLYCNIHLLGTEFQQGLSFWVLFGRLVPEFHNAAGWIQCNTALLPCSLDPTRTRCYNTLTESCRKKYVHWMFIRGSKRWRNTRHPAKDEKSSVLSILHCVCKAPVKRYLTCEGLLSPGEKCFKWQQHFSDTIGITCVTQDKLWCVSGFIKRSSYPHITWRSCYLSATSQEYFSLAEY